MIAAAEQWAARDPSDDEAQHWKQADAPVSVTLTAVKFADKDFGYAIGHGGTVLGTAAPAQEGPIEP